VIACSNLCRPKHAGNMEGVRSGLVHARRDILAILPAISQESYTRAYPQLAKLAMLQELDADGTGMEVNDTWTQSHENSSTSARSTR